MVDTNQYTKTHELYSQFGQWLGVDGAIDSNYFMINYALHAAEAYIKHFYNINLSLISVFEKVNKLGVFSSTHAPTKLIDVFTSGELAFPKVTYLDSSFRLVESEGTYDLNMQLFETSDYFANYLSGYVYPDTTDYSDMAFDDEFRLPQPKVFLDTNIPVRSPQEVHNQQGSLLITGTPTNKVFVNNIEVGAIGADGTYPYSYDLTQEVTTIIVKLVDATDEQRSSLETKLLLVYTSVAPTPTCHILGYTRRAKVKEALIKIIAPIGATLTITGGVSLVTTNSITDILVPLNVLTTKEQVTLLIGVMHNGESITPIPLQVEYDESLSTAYLHELDKELHYVPYLPNDLLIAVFKLANHFYKGTLYNNDNIDNFRTANDISTTYTSHTIPKDIKRLLSPYIHYKG